MIASGYENGNDATTLRSDPAFKLSQNVLPFGQSLASQSTASGLENWHDLGALLRMDKAMIEPACPNRAPILRNVAKTMLRGLDRVGGQLIWVVDADHSSLSRKTGLP